VIYPPPWDLSRQDPTKREENLPRTAIDSASYPPFRLVWCLEVFSLRDDELLEEAVLQNFDVAAFRKAMKRPPSDPMVGGGWPIRTKFKEKIEKLVGRKLKTGRHSYFISASALNLDEVKRT
jgi:hypothetical protein